MRSRTSCERRVPPSARHTPNQGCNPTVAAHRSVCPSPGRDLWPFLTTSERENTMPDPDPYLAALDAALAKEFPDVLAEFDGRTPPQPYGDAAEDEPDCQEWPEPEDDDLDLLGRSSHAATIDYRCTRQELEEAGYGDGYSEVDPGTTPDIDSEFMAAVVDPLGHAPLRCTLRDLLDSIEQFDWTAVPGLQRLMNALIDGMCDPCPLTERP